jgi:hypothetical protein
MLIVFHVSNIPVSKVLQIIELKRKQPGFQGPYVESPIHLGVANVRDFYAIMALL